MWPRGTQDTCPQTPPFRAAHRQVLRNVRAPRPEAAARVPELVGVQGERS